MSYFVYILECADTTLYIGSTNNLEKRLHHHNFTKQGAKYTRARRPVLLKYSESHEDARSAKSQEYKLKKLSRSEKLNYISKKPI